MDGYQFKKSDKLRNIINAQNNRNQKCSTSIWLQIFQQNVSKYHFKTLIFRLPYPELVTLITFDIDSCKILSYLPKHTFTYRFIFVKFDS